MKAAAGSGPHPRLFRGCVGLGVLLRVRGATSFLTDEEPLFVIDGMALPPRTGIFLTLDPGTIESITVLKDPGETAV